MISEWQDRPRENVDEQSPEESPEQAPQGELWVRDVKETGRWGTRSRREVVCVLAVVLAMTLATFLGVLLAVKNTDGPIELMAGTKIDPITGRVVSAYEFPKKPEPIIITDQEELDLILSAISSNSVISDKLSVIPKTVAELAAVNLDTADPFTKAAVWMTNVDSTNVQQDVVARFALAVIFHTTNGASWKNATQWLTKSNHCDWHGVKCCENQFSGAVCKQDSFGEVLELDFYKNNLVGSIPSVIVLLPFLHVMYLNKNELTGTIPSNAFISMTNFAKLYAQYNSLSGSIPVDLSSATGLNTMYIQGNNITGEYPESLCQPISSQEGLSIFGIDCKKITCLGDCCGRHNCFYLEETADK